VRRRENLRSASFRDYAMAGLTAGVNAAPQGRITCAVGVRCGGGAFCRS